MCVGPELVHRSESAKGAGGKRKGEQKGRNNLGGKEAKEVEVGNHNPIPFACEFGSEEEEGSSLSEAKLGSSPSNLELQASTKTTPTLHSKQEEEEGT
jgi:hypothetical protein